MHLAGDLKHIYIAKLSSNIAPVRLLNIIAAPTTVSQLLDILPLKTATLRKAALPLSIHIYIAMFD